MRVVSVVSVLIIFHYLTIVESDDEFTVLNKIRFPYGPIQGPFVGIFVALSVPVALPHHSLSFAYNFEANYDLPSNQSEFTFPPTISRMFSRQNFYDLLEVKLKNHGFNGKECLLRTICEAAKLPVERTGVLEEVIHIILTPSSSSNVNMTIYQNAELYGKRHKHCKKYENTCSINILSLFSFIFNL